MLALHLHLLRSALVHVNTLLLQDLLSEERWQKRLTDADRRALSPLFWTHVNPYGRFELNMNNRLDLTQRPRCPPRAPCQVRRPGSRHRTVSPDQSHEGGDGPAEVLAEGRRATRCAAPWR
jgi:hypothetical protein